MTSRDSVGAHRGNGLGAERRVPEKSASASRSAVATLFPFGYWGSGSATKALIRAIGQAEALRGFELPLWVDIRISRSVRVAGSRDSAFAELLKARYVWMPELGNKRVQDRRWGVEIQHPAATKDLLTLALAFARASIPRFAIANT
jgi:hypothetical protein